MHEANDDLYRQFDRDAADIVTETQNGVNTVERVTAFRERINTAVKLGKLTSWEAHQLRTMFNIAILPAIQSSTTFGKR